MYMFVYVSELSLVDMEQNRGYDDFNDAQGKQDPFLLTNPTASEDYIMKIRSRLQEDAHARKEREKRRRKVLVDQLRASEALEVRSETSVCLNEKVDSSNFGEFCVNRSRSAKRRSSLTCCVSRSSRSASPSSCCMRATRRTPS